MSEIRVAAPLFCPTMHGVIGETVKRRNAQDVQNRDIFARDALGANGGGIFAGV
jgi:hypothetical protein